MAEPLPTEDQSAASGFQADPTGEELMASLARADSAVQPAALTAAMAPVTPLIAAAYGAR